MQSRAARRSADLPGDANARELVPVGAAFSVPFLAGQKGDILRPEPEGRLYGTNLRADQGRRPLDGTSKDTFSNPHSAPTSSTQTRDECAADAGCYR